jgi:ribosome-binding factor A
MSNRTLRVGELIQREISGYLRKKYQHESVRITITGVEVPPDLLTGRIYFTVLGTEAEIEAAAKWLRSKLSELRKEVGRHIVLKNTPLFELVQDTSTDRGIRVLKILDELDRKEPR